MLSVHDFIAEHGDHPAIPNLRRDAADYFERFLLHMANDMILKKILANDYGNATDFSLAKLCRDWVRKQTDYREGW